MISTPTINGPIKRSHAKLTYDQVNANLSLPRNIENMAMLSTPLLLVLLNHNAEEN